MRYNISQASRRPVQEATWSERRAEVTGSTGRSILMMLLVGAVISGFVVLNVVGFCMVEGASGARPHDFPVHTLSAD